MSREAQSISTKRPSSAMSLRPPSSASSSRPLSALSVTRPGSRLSATRHARSKIIPLCQTLVNNLHPDGSEMITQDAVDYAVKKLEGTTATKTAASVDMEVVEKRLQGHMQKARINSYDKMAEALDSCLKRLKQQVIQNADLDQEIKMSRLPDHLQFLLQLSRVPDAISVAYADTYLEELRNPRTGPKPLTWADIIAEEPFTGEHWKGVYGLPPGYVRQEDEDSDSGLSSPYMSPLHSDLELTRRDSVAPSKEDASVSDDSLVNDDLYLCRPEVPSFNHSHREVFESLRARQYWRNDWKGDADLERPFDLADPSTLGPAFERHLATEKGSAALEGLQRQKYINEEDVVREVLMCLQGRRNIIFAWKDDSYEMSESTPRLLHLTLDAQASILRSFARMASTVRFLRSFTASIFSQSQSNIDTLCASAQSDEKPVLHRTTRTLEAFSAAVDSQVRRFDSWCAQREEDIGLASGGLSDRPIVVSLLSTEKAMQSFFEEGFEATLKIVRELCTLDGTVSISTYWPLSMRPPSKTTALLLDALSKASHTYGQRGDHVTATFLLELFVHAAEPVWGMVSDWLKDGMAIGPSSSDLEDEFFIERNDLGFGTKGSGLLDPEFWSEGYTLRQGDLDLTSADVRHAVHGGGDNNPCVPAFVEHVSEMLLASGKAKGLLRAMDITPTEPFGSWLPFRDVVGLNTESQSYPWRASGDWLAQRVEENVRPLCEASEESLVKVLGQDCGLFQHLQAIEGLYLMRHGDSISHFLDIVFAKMDAQKSWTDFHFLNTAFSDIISSGASQWIQPSLVRLSYAGSATHFARENSILGTVKALDGIRIEYAVPFPMHFIFTPSVIKMYSELFVYLMKIRRAKAVLERILLRGETKTGGQHLENELKVFYVMRNRLSWVINALLDFLTTHVIHVELARFHPIIQSAKSLDDMIVLHTAQQVHVEKLLFQCLLDTKTSALHRAVVSILDIALNFSQTFTSFAGYKATALDLSVSRSFSIRKHRSRRTHRQHRNVIGVGAPVWTLENSSDEDDEVGEDVSLDVGYTPIVDVTDDGLPIAKKIEKLSVELDSLVKFVRRGVEGLAGGSGDVASAFGVLAFTLEDWDR